MSKHTESVPAGRAGEVRAEPSPAPTLASVGFSRPSTQATVRDGILLRWNNDSNNMLRRPRTACSDGQMSNRSSAKIAKARVNMVIRKQKVAGMVKAMTASANIPVVQEKTAAELNYEAAKDKNQPYRFDKRQLLRQFHLRNGIEVDKMDLPTLPAAKKPNSRVGDPYKADNAAVRQMVNSYTSGPPIGAPNPNYQPVSCLEPQSSHLYSRPYRASYYSRTNRTSSAKEEFNRLVELDNLKKDKENEFSERNVSRPSTAEPFFKGPRPQTSAVSYSTKPSTRMPPRPASCHPKLRFQGKESSQQGVINDTSPEESPDLNLRRRRSVSAKSHRSCWISPLEMCNVPPDAKLKYIADEEKRRLDKIMAHTNRLLKNRQAPLHTYDRLARKLMAYKPQLDDKVLETVVDLEAKAKEEKDLAILELTNFLEESKDDQLLQELTGHLASNLNSKRLESKSGSIQTMGQSRITGSINPVLLGSQTSKALIAGFYMLMKNYDSHALYA